MNIQDYADRLKTETLVALYRTEPSTYGPVDVAEPYFVGTWEEGHALAIAAHESGEKQSGYELYVLGNGRVSKNPIALAGNPHRPKIVDTSAWHTAEEQHMIDRKFGI